MMQACGWGDFVAPKHLKHQNSWPANLAATQNDAREILSREAGQNLPNHQKSEIRGLKKELRSREQCNLCCRQFLTAS
jgi:hypothetical protein